MTDTPQKPHSDPQKPAEPKRASKPAPAKNAAPRAPVSTTGKGVDVAGAVIGAALFVPALAIQGARRASDWVSKQWRR